MKTLNFPKIAYTPRTRTAKAPSEDNRILFQIINGYGFHDSYIAACQQLYSASNTYYMTIHGNRIPIPVYGGALQGKTLSFFLSAISMKPLLRWLSIGSKGYRPAYQPYKSSSAIITYDDHGYADDTSITVGNIRYL